MGVSASAAASITAPLWKTVTISPEQSSWKTYAYPFSAANLTPTIDFGSALLMVGRSAIVQTLPRWRSAITWAQMKYSVSLSADPELMLHSGLKDLDKHQKSVLSEDFGVGVALEWLTTFFNYGPIAHGAVVVGELDRLGLLEETPKWKKASAERGSRERHVSETREQP